MLRTCLAGRLDGRCGGGGGWRKLKSRIDEICM